MKKCWLKCKLSRGLYPDDFLVRIPDSQDHDHNDVTFFACKDFVKTDANLPKEIHAEIDGQVVVTFVEHMEKSVVVHLPQDSSGEDRMVAVPKQSLQPIKRDVREKFGFVFRE
jgi:hypothetical protein